MQFTSDDFDMEDRNRLGQFKDNKLTVFFHEHCYSTREEFVKHLEATQADMGTKLVEVQRGVKSRSWMFEIMLERHKN